MLFGYHDTKEYATAIFKYFDTVLIAKYMAPALLVADALFGFLFQSKEAIYFLVIMYCLDFLTGAIKATSYLWEYKRTGDPSIKDKILVSKKFPRFLFTMLAALLVLTLLNFMGAHSIVFYPVYPVFYSVFLGQQFISIVENLGELKLIPYEMVARLKEKITQSKNENRE